MAVQETLTIRKTSERDGAAVWELVRGAGTLDLNSAYCYLLLCDRYRDTCAIAVQEGRVVGFVSAFIAQDRPDTLFVWQIAVDAAVRGRGVATELLRDIAEGCGNRSKIRYIEATVSPSNRASNRLFERYAASRGAELAYYDGGYAAALFPVGQAHEDEPLLRIGPLEQGHSDLRKTR